MNASGRILLWCAAAALLFIPALFIPRVMIFGNSDALFYGNILAMVTESLKAGEFFPRWFAQANAGIGSPVMLFYAPLAYMATALVGLPLTALHMDRDTQLLLGMFASQILCGLTSFLWLKRHFPARVALIGSLLYILLPYKFIYIYLHINLAQLWALALLPLWMMSAGDMLSGAPRAIGGYALAFAGVYYMHPLTLLAFAAAPAAHVLWFGRKNLPANVARLALAHALGIGICLAQLVPGQLLMGSIHAERFLEGNYDWSKNLFHVDVMLCAYYGMIAVVVGFAIARIPAIKAAAPAGQGLFWIAVLCVVVFLTQKPSAFIYEWVKPLQYLQFPAARLHAAALLAVVYLTCIWLTFHEEMASLGRIIAGRKALAILIATFTLATGARLYHLYSDPEFYSDTYMGDAQAADLISTPVPIYETQWGCIETKRAYYLMEHQQVPPGVAIASGTGLVAALNWQPPGRIAFTADIQSQNAQLTVRQCYFPLWQATADGKPLALSAAAPDGLTGLTLPRGSHTVELSLTPPPGAALSGWVSLLSLALSLALWVAGRPKKGETRPSGP